MLARQPLNQAIANADPELKTQLTLAESVREFSVSNLGLPDNGSYRNYVALRREFPVWTVVAAEEFSVAARSWCYPIVGCAAYRGYFSKSAADSYAGKLVQRGLETTVGGAVAYSTLGWFDDPLLPSMLRHGEADFAETLFHELAHQVLYIKGNSSFNEAFATVVGEQGALAWLESHRPEQLDDYQRRLQVRDEFSQLLTKYKSQLSGLYDSELPAEEMRLRKAATFSALRADYQRLKAERWQGLAWFDRWFEVPLNNARLAAFATYRDQVPDFVELLRHCENNFVRFYAILQAEKKRGAQAQVPGSCESS